MLKRLLLAVAVLACALPFFGQRPVQAATDDVTVTLHKRIFRNVRQDYSDYVHTNTGLAIDPATTDETEQLLLNSTYGLNGATFEIYDTTQWYMAAQADGQTAIEFAAEFDAMSRRDALKWVQAQSLKPFKTVRTAAVAGEDGVASVALPRKVEGRYAAYLIIETAVDHDVLLNVDLEKKSSPMMVVLPVMHPVQTTQSLREIHLYPKNVGYVRDPYFFKFGKQVSGDEVRLKGAVFALFRYAEDGTKLYLSMSMETDLKNRWIASSTPLKDDDVDKFISDADGLVNTGRRFLPSGTYYFEELQSVTGYQNDLTETSVKVEIPESWTDEADNELPVLINGEAMDETLQGTVQPATITKGRPRVYNTQVKPKEEVSTKPSGNLPQAGATVSVGLMVLGVIVMLTAWGLQKVRKRA
ncbi:pilin N-terminal domain-containing protein [Lacticaseibacillus daqingensis]|uniref:pilin N-terminal domain-containing protein n=1 Tax=Lacticaseibacillus daqingensis TaxID=2486014 RepID=UPI000F7AF8A4|nr:pilin N-terminal domain-containing protein [Lacticaseibacillus daqingensis]